MNIRADLLHSTLLEQLRYRAPPLRLTGPLLELLFSSIALNLRLEVYATPVSLRATIVLLALDKHSRIQVPSNIHIPLAKLDASVFGHN
jgi:hypothetical protein